jgi:mannose-1-phosphate guanylyltransferase
MYAAILAGGVGTRLWPRSRQSLPKQFTDITGTGRTMIQSTVDRIESMIPSDQTYVITGSRYRDLVSQQLAALPAQNILIEPSGRNTAPAIGLACIHLQRRDPKAVVAILSADHVIRDEESYRSVLQQAELAAQAGYLTVLGIEPDFPHTGYGYIKCSSNPLSMEGRLPVYAVERFLEKPDRTTAEAFLAEGNYYWNGGAFVSSVERLLQEIERQMPAMYEGLCRIQEALDSADADEVLEAVWPTLDSTSIDYGVMEHARQVAAVPMQVGWNDVGSWDALEAVLSQDENGNTLVQGEVILVDSHGNVVSGGDRPIALVGVEDLVVVDTGDALLIGHKKKMQQVKTVVDSLQENKKSHLL